MTVVYAGMRYSVVTGKKIELGKDSEQLPKDRSKGRKKTGAEADCAVHRVHGKRTCENECKRREIMEQ